MSQPMFTDTKPNLTFPPSSTPTENDLVCPKLVILEQQSLAQEKFAKNGVQKNVHVVVKNTPFLISVGFSDVPKDVKLDFNVVTVEALLMYDCDGERFVDFVNNKPLEYKGSISKGGDRMNLEIRLKKLSSHLEDMFFKIRIKGIDTETKEDLQSLYTTSQPIKVVSKPEQVTRILQKQRGEKPAPRKATRTKKRSLNDMMYDTMQNIEKRQQEQQYLLQQLLRQQPQATGESPNSSMEMSDVFPSKKGTSTDLEQAIQSLLYAYDNTDPVERPLKIRKVLGQSSTAGVSTLLEISGQIQCNAQRGIPPHSSESTYDNSVAPSSGPAQIDLQLIDDFYRELLLPGSEY